MFKKIMDSYDDKKVLTMISATDQSLLTMEFASIVSITDQGMVKVDNEDTVKKQRPYNSPYFVFEEEDLLNRLMGFFSKTITSSSNKYCYKKTVIFNRYIFFTCNEAAAIKLSEDININFGVAFDSLMEMFNSLLAEFKQDDIEFIDYMPKKTGVTLFKSMSFDEQFMLVDEWVDYSKTINKYYVDLDYMVSHALEEGGFSSTLGLINLSMFSICGEVFGYDRSNKIISFTEREWVNHMCTNKEFIDYVEEQK